MDGYGERLKVFAAFKPVIKTRPLSCDPAGRTEVHSLVCRSHVYVYLTMIKSLLRFFRDVAVVVHDDASLREADVRLLERHVRGIRVIRRAAADRELNRVLRPFPFCRRYRDAYPNALQLFDFVSFSRIGKIVSLDSDILFFRRPARLIDWMRSDRREVLYFYEPRPFKQKEFLARFGCDFPPHFNFGLVCFSSDIVDLRVAETLLREVDSFKWVTGQSIFPVLIRRAGRRYRTHPFPKRYYQGFLNLGPAATMRHYHSSAFFVYEVFRRVYLGDGARVIRELKRRPQA